MPLARTQHTATLLQNGRILVAGGSNALGDINDVSIYDPGKDEWFFVGTLDQPRGRHTATLLNDGSVLIVGGIDDQRKTQAVSVERSGTPRGEVSLFFPDGAPDELLPLLAVNP
jgi:hypothetical protein